MYDLIIIGAGPGGIALAAEACAAGIAPDRILVLEKAHTHNWAIRQLYPEQKLTTANYKGFEAKCEGLLCLEDMTKTGRSAHPPRPWLGLYATEAGPRLVVAGLAPRGPAEQAGLKIGDIIVDVNGAKPTSLADLWRKVWALGRPGVDVPLRLMRKDRALEFLVESADRTDFLKKPNLH